MRKTTVFLGGTCNGSTWRNELLRMLDSNKINVFNPVVDDWNEEAQANEDWHKVNDDFCLYVLTPEMTGFYSEVELVDASNKRPNKTLFCFLSKFNGKEFDSHIKKSLLQLKRIVVENGAIVLESLEEVADYLNNY